MSWDVAGAVRRVAQERAHAVGLLALHVDQEHVGRVRGGLDRELLEQARLQRSDADDEERAEPDGQQDDARLVARPRQVQHRVPQRERARAWPAARSSATSSRPGQVQHDREPRRSRRRRSAPTFSDAACQAVSADQRRRHRDHGSTTASSRAGAACCSSRSSSDGLTRRTWSSGTIENSSDTSTPMPMPCAAALHVTPYFDLGEQRSVESRRARSGIAAIATPRERDAEQAAGQAERQHLQRRRRR